VYARFDGSVAAPTAGLHFTDNLLNQIQKKGIESGKVTLHVGAGTFKPVIADAIANHEMHTEKIVVSRDVLKQLHQKINNPIIPVGTTSMRTLESLFWIGLKLKNSDQSLAVEQWDPYQLLLSEGFTSAKALEKIISYLEKNGLNELKAETRLMIAPGYDFKICTGIVTNFHQPKSTLLLLVSALIGENWKTAYDFALQNNFRFLSYGDSCLFLP
jgi:S-adenosylmethionine:tRNA ribosyltransferase-isomerase